MTRETIFKREMTITSYSSKNPEGSLQARRLGTGHFLERLATALRIRKLFGTSDDPICLSALDDTTLGRYGYSENQIHLMKEGTFQ
jgi:hypothetical protein